MQKNLQSIIQKNISKIVDFFKSNVKVKVSPKADKIRINCPYCPVDYKHPHGDQDYHLVLNLDWGIGKCFHCGIAKPIVAITKTLNIHSQYIELLQDITDFSYFDLQTLIRKDLSEIDRKNKIDTNLASKYIKENHLSELSKNIEAKEYALRRTRNNFDEIESYYADSNYLYLPIFKNKITVAFIARRYTESKVLPRYKYIKLDDDAKPVAFVDEIEENISTDTVYITEGYFDALAINSSFGDYRAIAIFSKSNTTKVIDNLYPIISPDTKIVITLDSPDKDPYIFDSIDSLYKKMKDYFQNVNICVLKKHDPSYIFTEYGPQELIRQLEESTISSVKYIKMRLLNQSDRKVNFNPVETVKLPRFLLELKKKGCVD